MIIKINMCVVHLLVFNEASNVMINRIRRGGYNWSLQGLIPGGAVLYKVTGMLVVSLWS